MARGVAKAPRNKRYAPKDATVKSANSLASLTELRNTEVPKYTAVKNTNNAYTGHRARGRAFLSDLVAKRMAEESLNGPNEDGVCTADLARAFDDAPPNQYSALALEMFLVQKCYNEGCGKDTAEGIHSAFAALWDQMDEGMYAGDYYFDKMTGKVKGCPARAPGVRSIVHSVRVRGKNKGASATRNHAEAMSIEDLQRIMSWSEKSCPAEQQDGFVKCDNVAGLVNQLEHGFMRAFLSSGFILWTRCFELLDLQPRDIEFGAVGPAPHFLPCIKVELLNRKGWQNEKGYEGAREPHIYNIYAQPQHPEMDMYTHLLRWKQLLESVLERPLHPDEYLFPHIGVNGIIRPDRKMSYDGLMKLLGHFCAQSGVDRRYTTHSLRRGGAQYRFMYAPFGQRWDLNRIRWWGGWAIGEDCDTLIKYLVDSLQNLQNDHSDALNPHGARDDADYFKGKSDNTGPPSAEEWRAATTATNEKIGECIEAVQLLVSNQPIPRTLRHILPDQHEHPLVEVALAHTSEPELLQDFSTASQQDSKLEEKPARRKKSAINLRACPLPNVSIPGLGRKPGAWRRALVQWTQMDPKTGLALMDWPLEWYSGSMRHVTGSLRSQRQVVYEEYHRLGGDDHAFLKVYPDADSSLKRLIDAIRANPESNTERQRSSKNGTPEARTSREPQSRAGSASRDDEMEVDD